MKQRRNVWRLSMWKWAGVVFLIAAATGGALYSMTVRTASTATGAALSPTAEGAAVKAPVASRQPAATAHAGATRAGGTQPGGSTYFIDPVTKEPHSPSAEEMQELTAAGGVTAATASVPEPIEAVNGAPGLRLTDEQMTYTIATKNADGKVSVEHADGKTEALKKVRAASVGGTKAGKERNDVR
jgi:hypothetical protein